MPDYFCHLKQQVNVLLSIIWLNEVAEASVFFLLLWGLLTLFKFLYFFRITDKRKKYNEDGEGIIYEKFYSVRIFFIIRGSIF